MTVPYCGDSKRWDCADCMKHGKHKTINNCEGKYPNSTFAKDGYQVGPDFLFQCPKSFIKKSSLNWIRLVDKIENIGLRELCGSGEISNYLVEVIHIVKRERRAIKEAVEREPRHGAIQ